MSHRPSPTLPASSFLAAPCLQVSGRPCFSSRASLTILSTSSARSSRRGAPSSPVLVSIRTS
eukprot:3830285-Prorocentrum_lima.AAC.1